MLGAVGLAGREHVPEDDGELAGGGDDGHGCFALRSGLRSPRRRVGALAGLDAPVEGLQQAA